MLYAGSQPTLLQFCMHVQTCAGALHEAHASGHTSGVGHVHEHVDAAALAGIHASSSTQASSASTPTRSSTRSALKRP
jgi:hypothetical protein